VLLPRYCASWVSSLVAHRLDDRDTARQDRRVRDQAERDRLRELVRRGYDQISQHYRDDAGDANPASVESTATYSGWVAELGALLAPGARVLDLGCGAGVPLSRALVERGFEVTGVDISGVQVQRARELVPRATFLQADMVTWQGPTSPYDAIVSLYALIHVPLEDQRLLIPRLRSWLAVGGYLLAVVGVGAWTGVEDYFGAEMFWDHADTSTYLEWFEEAGLRPVWDRFVPEGDHGHTLVLAQAG
jgi:2-polyprenyl-3-methyl-5-hydroxy-6-metoxy-1,4-benzoquinol methylase